jgi:hypothetical protein
MGILPRGQQTVLIRYKAPRHRSSAGITDRT